MQIFIAQSLDSNQASPFIVWVVFRLITTSREMPAVALAKMG